ncbi:MAG: hypothetical protein Q8S15_02565 [Erysipelotrichaceae bacterium]|nr:hypothetical protein [Erysipelotrichaceae bacterium]
MLKSILLSVAALICGALISLYGVFLSVFADGGINERLILIVIVLLLLFVLSTIFAYIQPHNAWLNAAFLGGGGVIILLLDPQNVYYFLYSFMIFLVCLAGVWVGKKLNSKYKKVNNHSTN